MPARATQPSTYPGGRALIEVIGPSDRFPDPVEICLLHQMEGADKTKHLDPRTPDEPWKTAIFWFQPETIARTDGRLSFDLPHGVTAHLRPNMPYILRVRGAEGMPVEERLVWKAIRGKSTPPEWTPPAEATWPAEPVPEQPKIEEPENVEPAEKPAIVPAEIVVERREPVQAPRKPFPVAAVAAGAILLAALGTGGWYIWSMSSAEEKVEAETEPSAPAPAPTTIDTARRLVQEGTPAAEAYAEAKRFQQAKALDGAFLLLRHAADKGSTDAAIAVGEMYDPATHSPETSPLPSPNPTQAAEWYRRAAETGNAEAQFRYGRLLLSGKTDDPQGLETGITWLRKAADQGHAAAKEALPK